MSRRPRAGAPRAAMSVVATVLVLGDVPALFPQVAQSLEQLVAQRQGELRSARATYDAAVIAFNVLDAQWQRSLDAVTQARRSGDESALERAWAQAQERAGPYSAQEQRVQTLQDTVAAARQALMEAIESRLDQLLDQMESAGSAQERLRLNALFTNLRNELQELDEQSRGGLRLQPVVLPDITYDPRDGPEERSAKAQLLERQAGFLQSQIDEAGERIRTLENRLRLRRQSGDLLASVDRFDDTRVPVVAGGPTRAGVPADSTAGGVRPLTLEEQITELQAYRQALEDRRQSVLRRAEAFRSRGGAITW